jgi:hypothetical protein
MTTKSRPKQRQASSEAAGLQQATAPPRATQAAPMSLQRALGNRATGRLLRPEIGVSEANGPEGAPLPPPLREKFSRLLDKPLDGVRLHVGDASAAAADALDARAYTVGQDIHFGRGEYAPASPAGERLIAHEVAHAVQQSRAAGPREATVSRAEDPSEVEAHHAADRLVAGQHATVRAPASAAIHRDQKGFSRSGSKAPKPTYNDALRAAGYVRDWFADTDKIAELLVQAELRAVGRFTQYSSKEYNETRHFILDAFDLALTALPAAAGLLAFFKHLRVGAAEKQLASTLKALDDKLNFLEREAKKFPEARNLIERGVNELKTTAKGSIHAAEETVRTAERAAARASGRLEKAHTVKLTQETIKQGAETHEKAESTTETRERADFEIETVGELAKLNARRVVQDIERRRSLIEWLDAFEDASGTVDLHLVEFVKTLLGPLPKVEGLEETIVKVGERFEVELYNKYYVSGGLVERILPEGGTPYWSGFPDKVEARIRQIPGAEEILLNNQALRHRRVLGSLPILLL